MQLASVEKRVTILPMTLRILGWTRMLYAIIINMNAFKTNLGKSVLYIYIYI